MHIHHLLEYNFLVSVVQNSVFFFWHKPYFRSSRDAVRPCLFLRLRRGESMPVLLCLSYTYPCPDHLFILEKVRPLISQKLIQAFLAFKRKQTSTESGSWLNAATCAIANSSRCQVGSEIQQTGASPQLPGQTRKVISHTLKCQKDQLAGELATTSMLQKNKAN